MKLISGSFVGPILTCVYLFSMSVLQPLFWLARGLNFIYYQLIIVNLVQQFVYPKAFNVNTHLNPHSLDNPRQILENYHFFLKHNPFGKKCSAYEITKADGTVLRGLLYVPESIKVDQWKNGFLWFEGTNSSSLQNHLDSAIRIADQSKKILVSVDHQGIGWSDGKVHREINQITDDMEQCIKDTIIYAAGQADLSPNEIAKKSIIYGHSLGGGLSVAVADRLNNEGQPIKAFSWASFASTSAVARELFGGVFLRISIFILMYYLITKASSLSFIFSTMWGSFAVFSLLTISSHYMVKYDKGILLPFFDRVFISPLLKLFGWQLDVSTRAKGLLSKGKLLCGHIMRHPNLMPRDPSLNKYAMLSGEDGFITSGASLTNVLAQDSDQLSESLTDDSADTNQLKNILNGSCCINNTGGFLHEMYIHTLGPNQADYIASENGRAVFKSQIDRISFFASDEYTRIFDEKVLRQSTTVTKGVSV